MLVVDELFCNKIETLIALTDVVRTEKDGHNKVILTIEIMRDVVECQKRIISENASDVGGVVSNTV